MLIIKYDPNDESRAIPDGQIETVVDEILTFFFDQQDDLEITISNETIITRFRLAILLGHIAPCDICFEFNGEKLYPMVTGELPEWPVGFCDNSLNMLSQMAKHLELLKW